MRCKLALSKPGGGGRYRHIAVGELFYRLAGVIVVRKVTADAAALLAPHQLGVGVRSGAERVVHSLQHSLTDTGTKRALLQVDISNAFNSCDRARVLRQLYEQPALSPMYRIADFGYAVPSQLLMQRCEGKHLLSSNGVRQGDSLSAILFCLYIRDVLVKVSAEAKVQVDAFFDDINVSGEPAEVMKALSVLQRLLPEVGLEFNTAKSHFAYFHSTDAPLLRSIRTTLAEHDIQLHKHWIEVVGAVVGRDEDAIRTGVAATLAIDEGSAAFFRRLQLDQLTVQNAMVILRQCGVPKMNYALRCMPPPCIVQQAAAFDDLAIGAAKTKLLLHEDEARRRPTLELLRAPLRHGGFGLTSAQQTSPAAHLGSMAAATAAPVFIPYSKPDCPLPATTPLHGWIANSMRSVVEAAPTCKDLLPSSASTFFQHFAPLSSSSSANAAFALQHQLSLQATDSVHQASLQRANGMKREDGGWALAHLRAVSATKAWTWKAVAPTGRELELTDVQYRMAARLNLGLEPMAAAAALPDECPLCTTLDSDASRPGRRSIRADPWHFLSCGKLIKREVNARHDDVARALYRCALAMGLRVQLEVRGLDPKKDLRPDLLFTLPGRPILSDVAICHPLAPGKVTRRTGQLGAAKSMEVDKRRKYTDIALTRGFEQLPFVAETCGGLGPSAVELIRAMAQAGGEQLAVWSRQDIIRQLAGAVAVAVQRGGVMTYLQGYDLSLLEINAKEREAELARKRAAALAA